MIVLTECRISRQQARYIQPKLPGRARHGILCSGELPLMLPHAPETEIYRGYDVDDLERVDNLADPDKRLTPGFLTDFFGIRVSVDFLENLAPRVIDTPPFPWDGYLAEGIEYASAAIALDQTKGPRFTAVELGAGWGPWCTLMAKLAQRRGFSEITSIGVEASSARFRLMQQHLYNNGLLASPSDTEAHGAGMHIKLLQGAAWHRNGKLHFPKSDSVYDAAMSAHEGATKTDYRGLKIEHEQIQAYSLPNIVEDCGVVDFMHMDVQGGEWEILRHSKRALDRHVRFMYIGTHSRKIEGDLIDLFHHHGWKLFREKPCRFWSMAEAPSLQALTYYDGGQLWRNMKLA
jgi:FkbM family methyltransferase